MYIVSLESKKIRFIELIDGQSNEDISIEPNNPIEFKTADEKGKTFFSRKVGKEYELFYRKDNGSVVKISNTQNYSPRICWEEVVKDFSYLTTPSEKVVFSFIEVCGDLAHSILHISNIDGTNQVKIDNDLMNNRNDFSILRLNGEFVILEYDQTSATSNLVTYLGKKNMQHIIMKDVSYFQLIY